MLIAACFAAMQLALLPSDGFITGDQGSKFLQARAFADHGPFNPSIDVLARDIDPEYRRQEPKLKNRRGRLVSEFLWLLPLLTAPFLRLAGQHGLYVVPALSVIACFAAAAALARRLGDPHALRSGWIVMLVTPLAAYGLELWEHAPAAACVLIAAVWLAPDPRDAARARLRYFGAGVAIAIGTLFREEVIAALPAFALARMVVVPRDRVRDLIAVTLWSGLGGVVVLVASIPMNLLIYGSPLPMHVTQDAWEVARNTPYLQVRRDIVVDLLLPASHAILFVAVLGTGAGAAVLEWWRREDADGRGFRLKIVHVSIAVALVIAVLLPMSRLAAGLEQSLSYRVTSAAHTWTFALALLYWPWMIRRDAWDGVAFLAAGGVLLFAGSALLVPTSGGGQWSPRFMLAVAPLLALASARGLQARGSVRAAIAIVFAASVVMQVAGVVYFARAKIRNAEMTHWLASRTPEGAVLISNIFWFPEVTATLASERRYLFSWAEADVPQMAGMAISRGLTTFNLVTSVPLTGIDAPAAIAVPGSSCVFRRGQQLALDSYGLTLSRYGCAE